jgi:peptide/nickel transport system substrate-binding protein
MQRRLVGVRRCAASIAAGILVTAALASPGVEGSASATPDNLTLHVLTDLGAIHLDPTAANTFATRSLLSGLVVRSLTQLVYDPASHQMVLEPDLATTLGTHNPTYTRWTFTLRQGVKFENGEAVTPVDVKYGIERSFDRSAFPTGPRFSNEYFLHGHTYHGPYRSGTTYDGIVINGQRITLKMAKPFPDLPYYLTFPAMGPMPPGRASSPARYQLHPWATGPYMFHGYTPGHFLRLLKNPYWDSSTDPYRTSRLNVIDVRLDMPRPEIDAALLADSGPAAASVTLGSVLPADYQEFRQTAPHRLIPGHNRCVDMFDPDNRQLTDIHVRRALAFAYPYQAVWAAGGDIQGVTRLPATNLEPPGTIGRKAYNPLPGHAPGTTDPAKAKALLKAAHRLHTVIKFAYETDVPSSVIVRDVLVQALRTAGFNPEPVATTRQHYRHDFLDNPKAPVNVRSITTCSPFPTGDSVLVPEFRTTDIAKHGFGHNYTAFSSKNVDDAMTRIQLLAPHDQPPAWNGLDERIQTRYFPTVVTGYHGVALMRGSRVQGFAVDNVLGMPTWNTITLRT